MKSENDSLKARIAALELERDGPPNSNRKLKERDATDDDLGRLKLVERQYQERFQFMYRAVQDQMIAVTQQCEWRIARLKEIHAREVAALVSAGGH
jgi:hypothetical protein